MFYVGTEINAQYDSAQKNYIVSKLFCSWQFTCCAFACVWAYTYACIFFLLKTTRMK